MVQLLSDNFLISCTNVDPQKQKYIRHLWNSLIYVKNKLGEKNTCQSPKQRQVLALTDLIIQKYDSRVNHVFSEYMAHNFKVFSHLN